MSKTQAPDSSSISRLDQVKVSQYFGCNTFSERTMRERLQKDVYKSYRQSLKRSVTWPGSSHMMKASCFSAVAPVIGRNQ